MEMPFSPEPSLTLLKIFIVNEDHVASAANIWLESHAANKKKMSCTLHVQKVQFLITHVKVLTG